ncbi:MAG: fumarate reductase subunit D [Myxococcota bacterium]|nr:fumarate reductase subunit D [Myxococcota bacterium]
MKQLLLKIEPIIWLLFGAGLSIGTMLLTGFVLVVGLAIPLGWVPADALDYERAHALASNLIGRLFLLGLIALPLWKGAHHLRSISLDFGGESRDGAVGSLLYLLAAAGSVAGIVAVIRI